MLVRNQPCHKLAVERPQEAQPVPLTALKVVFKFGVCRTCDARESSVLERASQIVEQPSADERHEKHKDSGLQSERTATQ
jgi:hypothetical protein